MKKKGNVRGNALKTAFRRTKEWKSFRKRLLEERGYKCQCCGKKTKLLQVHHADDSIENYTDLKDPSKFWILCSMCHRTVESLSQIKPENRLKIRNLEWVKFYERFLI